MKSSGMRQMKLGAFFLIPGHHIAAWRHPEAEASSVMDLGLYRRLAQTAERGRFDMIFLADSYSVSNRFPAAIEQIVSARPEPLTLLAALAAVTEHIGLAATASTTYNEPFHVARKFASLDHLSGGRAAWNVVTSKYDEEALNFGGQSHLQHELRYERAGEFVKVVTGLWDSWEDDAFLYDKENARYADRTKAHPPNHQGAWFSVKGPLNVSRPVQGHPVIVQAGSSEPGRELAARTAEVIFTAWPALPEAQRFYAEVKGRLAKYGRSPDSLLIMPGVFPVIGRTREEAQEKRALLESLVPQEAGVTLLSALLGVDLTGCDVDGPLPELPRAEEMNGGRSRTQLVRELAGEGMTIRRLYQRIAGGRGHLEVTGTPAEIADELESWFTGGAADGFNIMPPYFPGGLDDFVELVVPELQRRGLFRTEYEGKTLRDRLGLSRPVHPAVRRSNTENKAAGR
ncbi:LLM class flavin-dependent oxidoreductase [Paenibacillus mucilaginosus]|uniref:YxeK n=1 Tax=Paenibacillus mucilaginosus (strain KNP414) TaxID=1036673 RepID=F8FDZ7_PAEMK|nr:LLM class flavin-dependent oxidoreductase [Paenibacillus mucilaginosus]AEI43197.1 YxeK [Paenibacillus mucilaginosus KNP414]MCG7212243.1 LLM class flavin-dependent oxidoreductase [Paenibacillus mucilaginosus]WDM24791.1 LLM class flavin-dependent oxidoreductase [Paenibacillus mucilaginosus]